MSDKLEVGYLRSVLDQPPHILPVGLVDVIVHRFQIQAVHLQGVGGDLQTAAQVRCPTGGRGCHGSGCTVQFKTS